MTASKIVVVGSINGQFRTVFQKIAALHAKNAFAFAIITGNLFADEQTETETDVQDIQDLLDSKIDIPLPIYFALGSSRLPESVTDKLATNDGELCDNLTFLGKRSVFKTSDGIRIVALGGHFDANLAVAESKDRYLPFYTEGDANTLKGAKTADILITSQWPSSIRTGSKLPFEKSQEGIAHDCTAELCTKLKPRYHFSVSDEAFYEREPFFQPADPEQPSDAFHITRFISLARYDNPSKAKWIYAFSLDPSAAPPVALPEGVTSSPLTFVGKKRTPLPNQNEYRFSSGGHHNDSEHRSRKRRKHEQRAGPPDQSECFFCISNAKFAGHMVVSIGTECYLTTAKGPLSLVETYPSLQMPGHILIMPMAHTSTIGALEPQTRSATLAEMHNFRKALNSLLKARSKDALGAVVWEVSRHGGIHTHWQYLPVPTELVENGQVEAAFRQEAQAEKYPPFETREPAEDERGDFFRLILWNGAVDKDISLMLPLDESFRFDLQFGRKVMAKVLKLQDRIDWRACSQSQEDEESDATAIRKAFEPFEPKSD